MLALNVGFFRLCEQIPILMNPIGSHKTIEIIGLALSGTWVITATRRIFNSNSFLDVCLKSPIVIKHGRCHFPLNVNRINVGTMLTH